MCGLGRSPIWWRAAIRPARKAASSLTKPSRAEPRVCCQDRPTKYRPGTGAVVAAWPAASLVGSYELQVWLIRASGAPGRKPSAEQHCKSTACRGAARSVPAGAIDGGQHSRCGPDPRAQGRRPEDQPAGHPAATVSGQQSDGAPGPDADNRAAVAAYRLSAQVGNPLSERKLAQMFGRTSRRWARARIAEAQRSPLPIQRSNTPTTNRRSGLAAPFTVCNRRRDWCEIRSPIPRG